MHLLAVDDDPIALELLSSALAGTGHTVHSALSGAEALALIRNQPIHLVISDWMMPDMDGVALCRRIRAESYGRYIYIIMVTARDAADDLMEAFRAGADDYMAKPFDPAVLRARIRAAERVLSLQAREVAVFALARLAEWRDPETAFHLQRIREYVRILGEKLAHSGDFNGAITPSFVENLVHTSPLHDIGKVGIPDAVLFKRARLNASEFQLMQRHTLIGAATLEAASHQCPEADYLLMARDIALSHHERFDGKGYPHGLAGDRIPLCGRIVALADVYDAITNRRVYKKGYPHDVAREIIRQEQGKHFDPRVAAAFLSAEDAFIAVQVPRDPGALRDSPSATPHDIAPDEIAGALGQDVLPDARNGTDLASIRTLAEPLAVGTAAASNRAPEPCTVCPASAGGRQPLSLLVVGPATQVRQALSGASRSETLPALTAEWVGGLAEARERLGARRYDAIIIDLSLAASGETALIRRLCSAAPDVPVVGVGEAHHEALETSVLRAGAQDCIFEEALRHDLLGRTILHAIERHRLLEEVRALSLTDELTGVYNRRGLFALAEQQLMLDARMGWQTGLLYADVDNMKQINDTQGHAAGDQALRTVADAMRRAFRASDIIARVGGDEFAVVAAHASERFNEALASRLQDALVRKHQENGNPYELKVSVGTVVCPPDARIALNTLLAEAEAAMYRAKRQQPHRAPLETSAR